MRLANGDPYVQPGAITWETVDTLPGMLWLAKQIAQQPIVASDIETSDLSEFNGYILCAGFTWDGKHVYVVPEKMIPYLRLIFERAPPTTRFVWHNGKFDCRWIWRHVTEAARVDEDTMLLSYANDERRGIHDLEQVSKDWLNSPDWKSAIDAYLPKKGDSYAKVPRPILHKYMAYDIGNTYWLFRTLRPMVARQPHAEKLYTRTLIPASKFLGRVEQRGLFPDETAVQDNDKRLSEQIEGLEKELNDIVFHKTGHGIGNPNSPKQLCQVLYHDFGLKPPKGVESTDDDILDELPQIPVVVGLRRYRKPVKARSTYVKPLIATRWNDKKKRLEPNPKYIVHRDGLIHTTFLIHGTPTGRLASRGPNTQNVPRDPFIRNQFVARPGRRLVEVDLNQAELRSLACLSGDEVLCKIYTSEGMSLHEVTRASTFGQKADWTPLDIERFLAQFGLTHATRFTPEGKDRILEEQKMRAKAVNFGIVYGRTAPSLAEEFRVAVSEGQRWINSWFDTYTGAHQFIMVCRRAPSLGKDLVTPFGNRKRHGIVSQAILTSLENEAANFPHQSIASNINLHGAMEMDEQLVEEYDSYIINLVHDSILIDCPDDDEICRDVIQLATSTLEAVPPKWGLTRIPFKADPKIGYKWGSLSEGKASELMKMAA
jgi:DNA polymerase-1